MEDSSDSTSNLGELTSKICPTRRRLARTNGKRRGSHKRPRSVGQSNRTLFADSDA